MAFETRQEDGQEVQYYVPPTKELPTHFNTKEIEQPEVVEESVNPFDFSQTGDLDLYPELKSFTQGEFKGIDWGSGLNAESLIEENPHINFNYTPPSEAIQYAQEHNLASMEDVNEHLNSLGTQAEILQAQKILKPLITNEESGFLNTNPLAQFYQNQAYKGGEGLWSNVQGSGARLGLGMGEMFFDQIPTSLYNLAATPAPEENYRANLSFSSEEKNWRWDFLGGAEDLFSKPLTYNGTLDLTNITKDDLAKVNPIKTHFYGEYPLLDMTLFSAIGQGSNQQVGASIWQDGTRYFLDQEQLALVGITGRDLVSQGGDYVNRAFALAGMTDVQYDRFIPNYIAIKKADLEKLGGVERLLAMGFEQRHIREKDKDTWSLGPVIPGDLMDELYPDGNYPNNGELFLKPNDDGLLDDIIFGGRSYTPGLSGSRSMLGQLPGMSWLETKDFDWTGFDNLSLTTPYLGKDSTTQQFVEGFAGPMIFEMGSILALKKPLGKFAHLPGTTKYQRMITTGRKMQAGKPLLSSKWIKGRQLSLSGHFNLAPREFGFTSLATNYFYNSGETVAGGTFSPLIAEQVLGEEHLATKLLSALSTTRYDSTAQRNLKMGIEDIAVWGFLVGVPLEGTGVGLRGVWNLPGEIAPSLDMALTKNFNRLKGGFNIENSFNIDDMLSGQYDSIFERFDRGLTRELSLSNDDLRAIVTIKNDLKPIVSKFSDSLVNGIRLEGLQAKLSRLNQIHQLDLTKERPRKTYRRPESGATQAEPGSPWRQFTETNQRKPLWETPYTEQREIDLKAEGKLDEEINKVEKEIAETESRLGESMEKFEEEVVRAKSSITPNQKQSLVVQGVDPNFAPPIPSEIQKVAVKDIEVAPQYFQVKRSGRQAKTGVSGSLAESKQFEPVLSGVVSVWRDRQGQIGEAGKVYIVDGHNRLDLAKRSGVEAIDVRYIEVDTPTEARQIAAMQNVAQSQSTVGGLQSLDVADYLREAGTSLDDFADKGLNLRNSLVEEAVALQRLPDFLYKKFKAGELSKEKAFAYGSVPGIPKEVIADLYKIASAGRWGPDKISQAMFMARNATVAIEEGIIPGLSSYFKGSDIKQLLAARVEVTKQLKAKVSTLRVASNLEQANILQGVAGTTVNVKGSQAERLQAKAVLNTFNQLAGLEGEVTGLLKDIASEIKGRNVKALVEERLPEIINALKVESQGQPAPRTELSDAIERQIEIRNTKINQVEAKRIEQNVKEPPNAKTIEAEKSQEILDIVPTSDKTLERIPPKIKEQLNKIKQEQDLKDIDPWDTIEAKDQTLEIEGKRVDEPVREFFTTKEGVDLLEGKDIPSSELVPVSQALEKVDPRTPLSFFIRSAPKGQQAKIAIDRLVEAMESFADTGPGGPQRTPGLGPVNTVGDLLKLLNIGRVAIEEGVQKGLRDAEKTEAFRRKIAPYLTKATKLAIQRAMADIEKVQIYLKALQFEIEDKLKGAKDKMLASGREADNQLARIDEWEMPEFFSNTLKRLGFEDIGNRVYFEESPTFSDSKTPRVKFGRPKPTYAMGKRKLKLEFESDVDLAIYIVTSGKPSKNRALYVEWLTEELGIPEDYYTQRGELMRMEMQEKLMEGDDGTTYRVEDTRSWENRSYIEYMTFDIEDARIEKIKSEQDKELLRQLQALQDPKRPEDPLKPGDTQYSAPELPKLPRHIAQFGDRNLQSLVRGKLTEPEIQAAIEKIVTRIAPYVKVQQPIAYMAKAGDVAKKHAGTEVTDPNELRFVRGYYNPIQDLVMIARYIGSHPISIGERVWTAYHEAWHAVMRRHMTKGEFRLLLEGKKELEAIAARVSPSKADIILSGKYSFSEVTAMASSGWDVYKKYVVKPGMPEPTWAQPILKMRKIAKAVRRYIFGLMDGDTPAYKTWDEVFEAGREGKLGERGIVEAKNKFQRSFWMGGTENRFYEFGPNYGKQPDIDYEPATPTPDPSEIPNLMKRVNERIDEGNVSFREAVNSDSYQTVRRMISRGPGKEPGKTLYVGLGGQQIGVANKVLEDTVMTYYGDRSGLTGIDKIKLEEISKLAREQLRGTNFDIEKTIRLYEEARGGNIKSQQDLVTHVALLMHRDQNLYVLKELALEIQKFNDGLSEGDKVELGGRLVAVFQNQLMLDQAFVSATRKWGQIGRVTQKDWELIEPALPTGTPLVKQLNTGDVEKGLNPEDGTLGEGVYFTASDSAEGFVGRLPGDVLIADLPSTGKSLSEFLEDINLDRPKDGFRLSKEQKAGLQDWASENNYGGVRFEGKNGEDVVVVFDTNNANRIINSDAATYPARDPERATMRSLFEDAAIKSGKLLEKKLTPELAEQLQSGKYGPELEAIIDEMAKAVFNLGNSTEIEAKYYMEDLADLLSKTPNGKVTQRAITNFIRNAQFLRASTWAKVLGGGAFRAATMPMQQYVGAMHTRDKYKADFIDSGRTDEIAYDQAQQAAYRMKLNKKLFSIYAHQLPNMLRLAGNSFKHDEVFVNLHRGFFEDAGDVGPQYDMIKGEGNIDTETARNFEYQRKTLRKRPTGDEWYLKPTSTWTALAWKYMQEGLVSGARRGMGSMDTFLNAMVGPSVEKIRLLEFEADRLIKQGVELTPQKELEIEARVDEQIKKLWVDIEINGQIVKDGYFDSAYAKNAMDYVNFTDDIDVDMAKRTYQYGVRKAQEKGLTNNAEIVRYAEDYVNGKLEESNPNLYQGKGATQAEATFQGLRTAINTPSALLKNLESRVPIMGSLILTNRTPLNIAKATIRYTGMGQHIIDSAWRDINHEDLFIRERALGEWSTGAMLLTTGMGLLATGHVQLSGPEPLNKIERKERENLGILSNGIRFKGLSGSWSPWYDLQMFDSAATIWGILGSYVEGMKKIPVEEYANIEVPGDEALAHAGIHIAAIKYALSQGLQGQLTKNTMQSYKAIADVLQSFRPDQNINNPIDGREGLGAGQAELENILAKAVTGLVTSAARQVDPVKRTIDESTIDTGLPLVDPILNTLANTIKEIARRTPYLSRTQPPVLHPTTGDPIVFDGVIGLKSAEYLAPFGDLTKLLYGAFSPTGAVRQLTQSSDPVDLEFGKLYGKGGNFTIWSKRMMDLEGRQMNQSELNRLITIATKEIEIGGMTMHEYLTWMITEDPHYNALPSPRKGDVDLEGNPVEYQPPSQRLEHQRVTRLKEVISWYIEGAPGVTRKNPNTGYTVGSAKDLWMQEFEEEAAKKLGIKAIQDGRNFEATMSSVDSSTYGPQASLEQWRLLTADPIT